MTPGFIKLRVECDDHELPAHGLSICIPYSPIGRAWTRELWGIGHI